MTSATKLLQRAVSHERNGELQASEETLKKLITRHPRHSDALHLMGGVILKQQRPVDALNFFKRALETGTRTAPLFSNMGATCRQIGNLTESIMYYSKAIEIDPRYAPAWFNLGIMHEMQGDLESAQKCYEKTIELKPDFSAAHNNLANLIPKLAGGETMVLKHQEKAVQLKPQNANYQNSLARTLYTEGRHEESLECFQRAIELSPTNADYLVDCGVVLNMLERSEEALELLEKALEMVPDHPVALFNAGKIRHNSGQHEEAALYYRSILEQDNNHVSALLNLAKCERELHNYDESEQLFIRYQEITGNEKVTFLNLAFNKLYQDQLIESEELINKALEIDPKYVEAIEAMVRLRKLQDDFPAVRDLLKRVCMLKPKDIDCRYQLANCHYKLDEYASCEDRIMQILNLDDTHFPTWFLLGNLWGLHDKPDKAIECYLKTLELCPSHVAAHTNIAELSRGSGDLEKAREHFDLSLKYKDDPATRLKRSVLIPPIIGSREEILMTRQALELNLDEMISSECYVHPDREILPTLFYLAYHGMDDRSLLERYSKVVVPSNEFEPSPRVVVKRDDDRIRIGFISHHFKNHTIGNLNQGLIKKIDHTRFHTTVFSQLKHEDYMGRLFQNEADEFIHLKSNIGAAVELIQNQDLDILYYPDLGMDPYTFSLAHLRLAPLQCVSWGHPVTSGSPEIDYYVSTELIDGPEAQQHFTEELVRFKTLPTYFYYPSLPKVFHTRAELGLPEKGNLYVCPQSLFKFHPDMDDIFKGILQQDPEGYVILIDGIEQKWNKRLRTRYQEAMPQEHDRILFISRLDHEKYMSLVHNTDVMLDPLPFGGGNTSYQALALGIPIVTCPPVHQRGRFTQGLYRKIDVMDCVVESYEDYINLSVELALNKSKRDDVKSKILNSNSILFEEVEAVREFESFFEQIVQKTQGS
ncbi:tetratricopeptide repeat protein [Polystyrenella longa]|nr:tetratricopeptide repeat protein [Polystyrenella longa]